jgi:hypothetical protein
VLEVITQKRLYFSQNAENSGMPIGNTFKFSESAAGKNKCIDYNL